MIAYVKGKVFEYGEDYIIVDNMGIGYIIYMPIQDIEKVKKVDNEVTVHTYHYVREDQQLLYGFYNKEALSLFKNLIGVSGVGPKAGLSILSTVSPSDFILAVISGDEKTISKAPGIGKKSAQRIILELRDKFKKLNIETPLPLLELGSEKEDISKIADATEGLMALGYTKQEAVKTLSQIDNDLSIEDMLKEALKLLMRG
ncbi:Holliday junction branch migration protein RuvA [Clostridium cylindrosporum]|uniref:Holliday junction branch migration complex subunit RuvA n=1 Tax=Clostridium cylindrosporum DSM 605 TaxID=1121307 RepID=A0A0J8DAB8_CLOCY|nr:Holliday junction branch migration protein RuvA [Clostridium cylindrosporum]KMT21259.1 holliday junction ATP-dependent DNA helicase RuvA [Clostridium cylindrosporum DSM 605]